MDEVLSHAAHTYGEIIRRHMVAARDHGVGSDEQRRLFALAGEFQNEFPSDAKAWQDFWSPSPPASDGGE
jgi:hypothetical protein